MMNSPDHDRDEEEKDRDDYPTVQIAEKSGKWKGIVIIVLKLLALIALLYFFICSLDILSSAFRLIGGREAGRIISNSDLVKNPVVGVMIGVLVTVLVQSSSTSTSIVVTMVGSDILTVRHAIPIVMGANIGTSVTNTIVSMMQSQDRNEFRRAFAAATVHDMFNWLSVLVLLPVEVAFHYLEFVTDKIMELGIKQEKGANVELLSKLTKPFTSLIVELDRKVLDDILTGVENNTNSLLKICCSKQNETCLEKCDSLFAKFEWSDTISGIVLLVVSLAILCTCLIFMVKVLNSMLKGQIMVFIQKYVNKQYRFPYSVIVDYLAILIGCIMTILVQSSSIFTSALTPLAGIGVVSLERMYPLTLGSNIGTTTTGILAALASSNIHHTLQLAFCHLLFNVTGILIFYPIPFMRFPIPLSRALGNVTANYRWFSIFYLIAMFFLLPLFVFGLSIPGYWALGGVGIPILIFIIIVVVINIIQSKKPSLLPLFLQNWEFLPLWMHSLEPIDRVISKVTSKMTCLKCCAQSTSRHDSTAIGQRTYESQLHILGSMKNSNSESQLKHAYDNEAYVVHWNGTNGTTNGIKKDTDKEVTVL